mmetsp:Transcript_55533/g.62008  ORF Transcript_55533/g.62008 Transcript_55533/m.62008 type:complete len:82 (+) Transcript_55533:296-541(+)
MAVVVGILEIIKSIDLLIIEFRVYCCRRVPAFLQVGTKAACPPCGLLHNKKQGSRRKHRPASKLRATESVALSFDPLTAIP